MYQQANPGQDQAGPQGQASQDDNVVDAEFREVNEDDNK